MLIAGALGVQVACLAILFVLLGHSTFIDGETGPDARPSDMLIGYALLFASSVGAGPLGSWGVFELLGAPGNRAVKALPLAAAAGSSVWAAICGYGLLVLLALV